MKKATITLTYDAEKLSALQLYLKQKEQTVEGELTASLENLYTKAVPFNVRNYIDLLSGTPKPADKKRKPKPSTVSPPVEAVPAVSEDTALAAPVDATSIISTDAVPTQGEEP